ncbi:hypothetical protein DSO57_1011031 [Entomophthora muscae]|uniref:Uncharacterized protein n=1 Tax=Entomophthora muscae TaxID=34485 RepID=A0ACC2S8R6_9FUNG|nr:hypothetical protein DSO57_1011031 [Entomophthora muscae]
MAYYQESQLKRARSDCREYRYSHVSISPSVGHFEDESLAFAFASRNELMAESGNTIVQFLDPVQLTCPTHAGGE